MFDRPAHMEPMFSKEGNAFVDLAMDVYVSAAELSKMVHPITREEITRCEVPRLIGLGERTATALIKQLLKEELVVSDSHKAPIRFHIPAKVVGYYFPDLYPAGSI